MNPTSLLRSLLSLAFGCAIAVSAHAQASRTWVSGVGDDANPCSRTAPCKTLAGAYSKTAAGGEIDVLDPAGVGAVTISKALTIDGGGGQVASVLTGGNGIIINAGANDKVTIRNLSINGGGVPAGISGIVFNSGRSLTLDHCHIDNFTTYGVSFQTSAASSLLMSNCDVTNIGSTGVVSSSTSGENRVSIAHCRIANSNLGVKSGLNTEVTIKNSVISNNTGGGALADGNSLALLTVDDSLITNNDTFGIHAGNNGIALLTRATVIFNSGNGLQFDGGGQIISFGQNSIIGNSGTQAPSSTTPMN